jgi:hypothetical protein
MHRLKLTRDSDRLSAQRTCGFQDDFPICNSNDTFRSRAETLIIIRNGTRRKLAGKRRHSVEKSSRTPSSCAEAQIHSHPLGPEGSQSSHGSKFSATAGTLMLDQIMPSGANLKNATMGRRRYVLAQKQFVFPTWSTQQTRTKNSERRAPSRSLSGVGCRSDSSIFGTRNDYNPLLAYKWQRKSQNQYCVRCSRSNPQWLYYTPKISNKPLCYWESSVRRGYCRQPSS